MGHPFILGSSDVGSRPAEGKEHRKISSAEKACGTVDLLHADRKSSCLKNETWGTHSFWDRQMWAPAQQKVKSTGKYHPRRKLVGLLIYSMPLNHAVRVSGEIDCGSSSFFRRRLPFHKQILPSDGSSALLRNLRTQSESRYSAFALRLYSRWKFSIVRSEE